MKRYNVKVNRTVINTITLSVDADSIESAEKKAKDTASHTVDGWDECSTEYMIDDLMPTHSVGEYVDAFNTFDPSYVMDRKAQIDFLENYLKAWDLLGNMNILTEEVINGMAKELHLFYDANHLEHDCAEAVLNRLLTQKEYKLQVVRFGNIYFEFMPTEDDQNVSDEWFDYCYQEERGTVQVLLKNLYDSVIVHEQDIQK